MENEKQPSDNQPGKSLAEIIAEETARRETEDKIRQEMRDAARIAQDPVLYKRGRRVRNHAADREIGGY